MPSLVNEANLIRWQPGRQIDGVYMRRKPFLCLDKFNQIWTVSILFWLIWHQTNVFTVFRLMLHQTEVFTLL